MHPISAPSSASSSLWRLLLCCCCCCCCLLVSPVHATKLVQLQLLFRHGVRNPLKLLPNDPYAARYNGSLGQLTPAGVAQMRQLGRFVRDHYKEQDLLPAAFVPGEMWAYSTDTDRTLASGQAFLSGLFPGANGSAAAPLVPLHSAPQDGDPFKPTSFKCPARDSLLSAAMSGPAYHAEEARTRDFLSRLAESTGKAGFDLHDAWTLGSSAQMWLGMGLRLPSWLSVSDYQQLQAMRVKKYELMFGSRAIQRFCGGPILARILDRARARLTDSRVRLWIYSGHDSTIAALTAALGVTARDLGVSPPPPAALLAIEVYSDSTLRFVYCNETGQRPTPLRPPVCDGGIDCHIDRLSAGARDLLGVGPLPAQCRLAYDGVGLQAISSMSSGRSLLLLFLGVALVGVACVGVLLALRRRHQRRGRDAYGQDLPRRNGDYAYTPLTSASAEDEDAAL